MYEFLGSNDLYLGLPWVRMTILTQISGVMVPVKAFSTSCSVTGLHPPSPSLQGRTTTFRSQARPPLPLAHHPVLLSRDMLSEKNTGPPAPKPLLKIPLKIPPKAPPFLRAIFCKLMGLETRTTDRVKSWSMQGAQIVSLHDFCSKLRVSLSVNVLSKSRRLFNKHRHRAGLLALKMLSGHRGKQYRFVNLLADLAACTSTHKCHTAQQVEFSCLMEQLLAWHLRS